jgi:hypothetical protein
MLGKPSQSSSVTSDMGHVRNHRTATQHTFSIVTFAGWHCPTCPNLFNSLLLDLYMQHFQCTLLTLQLSPLKAFEKQQLRTQHTQSDACPRSKPTLSTVAQCRNSSLAAKASCHITSCETKETTLRCQDHAVCLARASSAVPATIWPAHTCFPPTMHCSSSSCTHCALNAVQPSHASSSCNNSWPYDYCC